MVRYAAGWLCALFAVVGVARGQCARWLDSGTSAANINCLCAWSPPGSAAAAIGASCVVASTPFGVALWDGQQWTSLGALTGTVNALAVYNNELYAAGSSLMSGDPPSSVRRWTGSTWQRVGDTNGVVYSLLVVPAGAVPSGQSGLYAGGAFNFLNGAPQTAVLHLVENNWVNDLNTPSGFTAKALISNGTLMYAGGFTSPAAGSRVGQILSRPLSFSGWQNVATTDGYPEATVNALASYGGDLFVSGVFSRVGSTQGIGLVRLSGTFTTNGLATSISSIEGLTVYNGSLIAVGNFFTPASGPTPANASVARWTEPPNSHGAGGSWAPMNYTQTTTLMRAAIVANGELVIGGETLNNTSFGRWTQTGIPWLTAATQGAVTQCGSVSLVAQAAYGYNPTYLWRRNGGSVFSFLSGANGPVLSGQVPGFLDASGTYTCQITAGACGTAPTPTVNLSYLVQTIMLEQPQNDYMICPGGTLQIDTSALYQPATTYQWQALLSGGWTNIANNGTGNACGDVLGATSPRLILSDGPAGSVCGGEKLYADGRQFRVNVNAGPCTQVTSTTTTLHLVLDPPVFSLQPVEQATCPNGTVTYSVAASRTSGAPITFQWQYYDPGSAAWTLLPPSPYCGAYTGADTDTITLIGNSATLTCALPVFANGRRYRCVANSDCFSTPSDEVRLWVDPADIGQQGGLPGSDGQHDNNDFIVFINDFFAADSLADMGRQGGLFGHDGAFDNNDFIVFINQFFTSCP